MKNLTRYWSNQFKTLGRAFSQQKEKTMTKTLTEVLPSITEKASQQQQQKPLRQLTEAKSNQACVYTAEHKKEIISQLSACQAVQRTYGKQAEDIPAVCRVFISDLSEYPPDDVVKAIAQWRKTNQEFPTVADIVKIIFPQPVFSADLYRELQRKRKEPNSWLTDSEKKYIKMFESNMMKGI